MAYTQIDLSSGSFVEPVYAELSGSLSNVYSELSFTTSGPKHTAKRLQVFASIIRAALSSTNNEVYWLRNKPKYDQQNYTVSYNCFRLVVNAMNEAGWITPRTDQRSKDGYAIRWVVSQELLLDRIDTDKLEFVDQSPPDKPPLQPSELVRVSHRTLQTYLTRKGFRLAPPALPPEELQALRDSIEQLNEMASQHTFDGLLRANGDPKPFRGFYRTFIHDLQGGGRLYGGCEQMKPEDRLKIRIDGEAVSEVDIVSCQPSILLGRSLKANLPFDTSPLARDFYSCVVEALDGQLTRDEVKLVVNKALGTANIPKHQWPNDLKEARQRLSESQQTTPKWSDISDVILKEMPFLKLLQPLSEDTFTLQHTEAAMLYDVMWGLYKHKGVAALPVHDSLVVPQSQVDVTKKALENSFWFKTGVVPMLRVTTS
ncbi:hypothetical protein [Nereida ignava]|uniref:hypothetical protein n=1 Tax=Nereida ignava TaxID=282199 RepID=UPI002FE2F42E